PRHPGRRRGQRSDRPPGVRLRRRRGPHPGASRGAGQPADQPAAGDRQGGGRDRAGQSQGDPDPPARQQRHADRPEGQPEEDPPGKGPGPGAGGRRRGRVPGDLLWSQEKETPLLDYGHVILKRRWVVYTPLTVVVSVTTLGSLLQRPIYTATTRLQI